METPISNSTWHPPWETETWQADAHAWIKNNLAERNIERTGDFDQFHIRSWSTVIRIPTDQSDLFFKAGAPVQEFEPGLLLNMNAWAPGYSIDVLAAEVEKGWMLMPDGGQTLRKIFDKNLDIRKWETILPRYAELQQISREHSEALIEAGCHDRRLNTLMDYFETMVNDLPAMAPGHEDSITKEEHDKLLGMTLKVKELVDALGEFKIPEGIDHGDLHDANVLVKNGKYTFFDWGDASVTHPFFSMVVIQRSIAYKLGIPEDSNELDWLRDAYLAKWSKYGSDSDLIQAYELAQYLGRMQRATNWYTVIKMIAPAFTEEDHFNAAGWLGLFLEYGEKFD